MAAMTCPLITPCVFVQSILRDELPGAVFLEMLDQLEGKAQWGLRRFVGESHFEEAMDRKKLELQMKKDKSVQDNASSSQRLLLTICTAFSLWAL